MNCASNTTIASESKCEILRMVEDASDETLWERKKERKIRQERMRMKEKDNERKYERDRERKREWTSERVREREKRWERECIIRK